MSFLYPHKCPNKLIYPSRFCPSSRIPCASSKGCYTAKERCNGKVFCDDASDEKGCSNAICKPSAGMFLCRNKRSVLEVNGYVFVKSMKASSLDLIRPRLLWNKFVYTTGSITYVGQWQVKSLFGLNSAVRKKRETDGPTDRRTDRRTDGQTDGQALL